MPDQGQFILVCAAYFLHQRSEGVAGAVGRVLVPLHSVYLCDRVVNAALFQDFIEVFSVFFQLHLSAVAGAEHIAGYLAARQVVYDGLNLWADGDNSVLSCFRLGAAGEGLVLPVIGFDSKLQQLRRAEPKITLSNDVVGIFHLSNVSSEGLQRLCGEPFFSEKMYHPPQDIGPCST